MSIHQHQGSHANMATWRQDERGFTVLELMAGVVVTLMVVAAGFTALTGTQKAATVNDQTTQMQQNARLAMELISRDVKMAGFGMTGAVGACPNAINPQDNNTAGADTGPDSVSLVVPITSNVAPTWTLSAQVAGGPAANILTLQAGAVAAMVAGGLAVNDTLSIGGVMSATVSAIDSAADQLTLTSPVGASAIFTTGTQVYRLQCLTYSIGPTIAACAGTAPCLLRGGVPIADGIEDLQLAYACDGCTGGVPDDVVDDQNGSNTFDTADFISNSTWATAPLTPATIRLVQISIVARQAGTDQGFGEAQTRAVSTTAPVVVGDHNPANGVFVAGDFNLQNPPYQQMRRRVLIRTVDTRNLGL